MPITRLLTAGTAFKPDEIAILVAAFEDALRSLRMTDRVNGATDIIARRIIELASQGKRDRTRLCEGVLRSLSK